MVDDVTLGSAGINKMKMLEMFVFLQLFATQSVWVEDVVGILNLQQINAETASGCTSSEMKTVIGQVEFILI